MVGPDSDIDEVVEGLEKDAGEFVIETETYGQNRLRVAADCQGIAVYPETVLEYLALAGWRAERTVEQIRGEDEYIVIEFIRGDELENCARRNESKFDTLDLSLD